MIRALSIVMLVIAFCAGVCCQEPSETRKEIWLELDVYVPVNEKFRLFFLVSETRAEETRRSFETTFGAHVDYTVNKRLVLRNGYRYTFAPGEDDTFQEHRIVTEQTFRQDLPLAILLSDRNREDWRLVNGNFSFRYRNRLRLEREFRLWGRSFTPYGSVEAYYDSRFDVWNRNRLTAGMEFQLKRGFPLLRELTPRKQVILDLYYTKQNDSRSQPHHIHAFGASLALHF
ncbi:MAG TPA: DUF2490 domain-containing protein [Pyrinomonadaceae bacterium]|nr:DUF2490 domain-containing protein [Pyrinomonadaceae bacterium]